MTYEIQTREYSELSEVINPDAVPSQHDDTILTEEIEARMKLPSTAVLLFFIEADEFSTVEDIISMVKQYKKDTQAYLVGSMPEDYISADYRKLFWCTVMNKWKAVNFYFNTSSLTAHQHGYNRKLLEPYMGKDYICSGAMDGNHFSEEQSRLAGCIKLCDVPLESEAIYYTDVIAEIACELQKLSS